ncbi:hypothetical protein JUM41_24215 [Rhizobium pusense]|uniref:hypothetical protein n=1 Tax=Agrobacterium pusense TaxID=648995 RepID=UPI001FCD407C|nr:hypothetical protein [Agrobacterium pusense]MCJ2877363.1 hypothetical protein [Agrobacterium pusense]
MHDKINPLDCRVSVRGPIHVRGPFPGGASKTSALVIQLLQIRWRVTLVSFRQAYDGNLSSNDTNAKEQASENAAALRITLKREPATPPGDGFFLSPAQGTFVLLAY